MFSTVTRYEVVNTYTSNLLKLFTENEISFENEPFEAGKSTSEKSKSKYHNVKLLFSPLQITCKLNILSSYLKSRQQVQYNPHERPSTFTVLAKQVLFCTLRGCLYEPCIRASPSGRTSFHCVFI